MRGYNWFSGSRAPIQQRAKHVCARARVCVCVCVCVRYGSLQCSGGGSGEYQERLTPLTLPSFAHSPPSHNYTLLFFIQSNSTPYTFISSTAPHCAHFSVFCVKVFIAWAHVLLTHLGPLFSLLSLHTPFCTSLSLPGAPASVTTHLPSSPAPPHPIHTPIL